jgi:hypothetical protein
LCGKSALPTAHSQLTYTLWHIVFISLHYYNGHGIATGNSELKTGKFFPNCKPVGWLKHQQAL